MLTMGT